MSRPLFWFVLFQFVVAYGLIGWLSHRATVAEARVKELESLNWATYAMSLVHGGGWPYPDSGEFDLSPAWRPRE